MSLGQVTRLFLRGLKLSRWFNSAVRILNRMASFAAQSKTLNAVLSVRYGGPRTKWPKPGIE